MTFGKNSNKNPSLLVDGSYGIVYRISKIKCTHDMDWCHVIWSKIIFCFCFITHCGVKVFMTRIYVYFILKVIFRTAFDTRENFLVFLLHQNCILGRSNCKSAKTSLECGEFDTFFYRTFLLRTCIVKHWQCNKAKYVFF